MMSKVFFMLLATVLCHTLPVNTAFADNATQTKKELNLIHRQIQKIKNLLFQDKNKKNTLQQELQKNEEISAKLALEIEQLDKIILQQIMALKKLKQQQVLYQIKLTTQRNALAQQIRTAYLLSRNQSIKLLLNQQNPQQFTRFLTYYDYLNKARLNNLQSLSETLQQLQRNMHQIQNQTTLLQTTHTAQQNKQKDLIKNKYARQQILIKLNQDIVNRGQKLARLIVNQKTLEQIIKTLQANQAAKPLSRLFSFSKTTPFTKLKGKLPWPVRGNISKHFGTSIEQSELRYNGVLLNATEGQKVQAISHGQVIFANWLQGFGLLMIIDHGNGYMTLYGQNHTLYKKSGDTVKPGEIIASVGDTGGASQNGLYFEIRHNGHPINPELWCHV